MAAPHVFLIYSILDAKGKTSTTKMNFPVDVSISVLQTFAASTATMINSIIKGKIVSAGIGIEVDLSSATIRSSPDSNSDVEEGARFVWTAASGAKTEFRIPTFDEAKLLAGTKQVDLEDSDVDDFVTRITAGQTVSSVTAAPSDDRGSDIDDLLSARESFTSSRG